MMSITLEQAIEIHARALRKRLRHRAAASARTHGTALYEVGDYEGHGVWFRIAEVIERFEAGADAQDSAAALSATPEY